MVAGMIVVAHAAHWLSTIATIFGPAVLILVALLLVERLGARDADDTTADR